MGTDLCRNEPSYLKVVFEKWIDKLCTVCHKNTILFIQELI